MAAKDYRGNEDELDAALGIIEDAIDDGQRDGVNGGIPMVEIAARSARTHCSVEHHVRSLMARGEAVMVWGVNPETGNPRESYLPSDHPDAPEVGE